ncbi:MAG: hypothetical protein Q7U00_05620 [Sulfurimonas sp.]|nr:hypothetical protein [Sulfurimonas sp.]
MQESSSQTMDKFELHLDEMIVKLQSCQDNNSLKSCSSCEFYLTCELRTDYVKSVYNSMSKGDTGGFEF